MWAAQRLTPLNTTNPTIKQTKTKGSWFTWYRRIEKRIKARNKIISQSGIRLPEKSILESSHLGISLPSSFRVVLCWTRRNLVPHKQAVIIIMITKLIVATSITNNFFCLTTKIYSNNKKSQYLKIKLFHYFTIFLASK